MNELRVDGGASANNLLMQFQADLLRRPRRAAESDRNHRPGRGLSGRIGGRLLEEINPRYTKLGRPIGPSAHQHRR